MSSRPDLLISSPFIVNKRRRAEALGLGVSPVDVRTHRQCTTVRPSPPLYSSCHLSTWRMSFRKERLDTGVSLYIGQPRNWNCCTIRYPSWGCRGAGRSEAGREKKKAGVTRRAKLQRADPTSSCQRAGGGRRACL